MGNTLKILTGCVRIGFFLAAEETARTLKLTEKGRALGHRTSPLILEFATGPLAGQTGDQARP